MSYSLPSRCTLPVQEVCKACQLLEGLNRGLPRLGISRSRSGLRARLVAAAGCSGDCGEARAGAGSCSSSPCLRPGAGSEEPPGAQGSSSSGAGPEQLQGGAAAERSDMHGGSDAGGYAYLRSVSAIAAHPSARAPAPPPP